MINDYQLFFIPNQYGFTAGKSCVNQLFTAVNFWTESLEGNCVVDVIYFDLTKAFELVPHICLLTKLEPYGLTRKFLGWIRNFLVGRRQKSYRQTFINLMLCC